MAIYCLIRPLLALAVDEEPTFTMLAGCLVRKDNYIPACGLTSIGWARKTVTVVAQDLVKCIEPFHGVEESK